MWTLFEEEDLNLVQLRIQENITTVNVKMKNLEYISKGIHLLLWHNTNLANINSLKGIDICFFPKEFTTISFSEPFVCISALSQVKITLYVFCVIWILLNMVNVFTDYEYGCWFRFTFISVILITQIN